MTLSITDRAASFSLGKPTEPYHITFGNSCNFWRLDLSLLGKVQKALQTEKRRIGGSAFYKSRKSRTPILRPHTEVRRRHAAYEVGCCGVSIFFCLIALTLSTRSSACFKSSSRACGVASISAF